MVCRACLLNTLAFTGYEGSIPLPSVMKCKQIELGIELIPENDFERDSLKKIANEEVKGDFEDSWDQTGNFIIEKKPHPWDK